MSFPSSIGDLQSLPGYHALFHVESVWRKRHMFSSRLQLSPTGLIRANGLTTQMEDELSRRSPGFGVMAITGPSIKYWIRFHIEMSPTDFRSEVVSMDDSTEESVMASLS